MSDIKSMTAEEAEDTIRDFLSQDFESSLSWHWRCDSEKEILTIMIEELDRLRKRVEDLEEAQQKLLNAVNRVTASHRHGNGTSVKDLDNLANIQIEVEKITITS